MLYLTFIGLLEKANKLTDEYNNTWLQCIAIVRFVLDRRSPVLDVQQENPAWKLTYGEMQYAITLEMKYKIVNRK